MPFFSASSARAFRTFSRSDANTRISWLELFSRTERRSDPLSKINFTVRRPLEALRSERIKPGETLVTAANCTAMSAKIPEAGITLVCVPPNFPPDRESFVDILESLSRKLQTETKELPDTLS